MVQLREARIYKFELKEKEDLLLYCIGTLEELIDHGLISGPRLLTKTGKRSFDRLIKRGYKPNDQDFEACVKILLNGYF